jgi:hypothetical protein
VKADVAAVGMITEMISMRAMKIMKIPSISMTTITMGTIIMNTITDIVVLVMTMILNASASTINDVKLFFDKRVLAYFYLIFVGRKIW